jgi:heme/copper-type cytochrome/quinol oxidase subunit 1
MSGRMLDEPMGRLQFWLLFVGFNVAFFPMHQLGIDGMPRRVGDYADATGWGPLNIVASAGTAVIALGIGVFLRNFWVSIRYGPPAGDDPWGGNSLEWATSSPPPHHNFTSLPPIRSERPVFDARMGIREERVGGVVEREPSHEQVPGPRRRRRG